MKKIISTHTKPISAHDIFHRLLTYVLEGHTDLPHAIEIGEIRIPLLEKDLNTSIIAPLTLGQIRRILLEKLQPVSGEETPHSLFDESHVRALRHLMIGLADKITEPAKGKCHTIVLGNSFVAAARLMKVFGKTFGIPLPSLSRVTMSGNLFKVSPDGRTFVPHSETALSEPNIDNFIQTQVIETMGEDTIGALRSGKLERLDICDLTKSGSGIYTFVHLLILHLGRTPEEQRNIRSAIRLVVYQPESAKSENDLVARFKTVGIPLEFIPIPGSRSEEVEAICDDDRLRPYKSYKPKDWGSAPESTGTHKFFKQVVALAFSKMLELSLSTKKQTDAPLGFTKTPLSPRSKPSLWDMADSPIEI